MHTHTHIYNGQTHREIEKGEAKRLLTEVKILQAILLGKPFPVCWSASGMALTRTYKWEEYI